MRTKLHLAIEGRRQRTFLWFGIASTALLCAIALLRWRDFEAHSSLTLLFLLASLPALITYWVAVVAIVRTFRYWILGLALLAAVPKLLVVVLGLGPFVFLGYALLKTAAKVAANDRSD